MSLTVTWFKGLGASDAAEEVTAWQDLVAACRNPKEYPTKQSIPLIKMARFGALRSDKNSLRHNVNVLAVSGLELDYDAEKVPASAAASVLQLMGVTAAIYSSPSNTPTTPRWRVLLPLSREHAPESRRAFAKQADALLGGIVAAESFVLSQSFYFGRVAGAPYEFHESIGQPIDLCGLPAVAPEPPPPPPTYTTTRNPAWRGPEDDDELIRRMHASKPSFNSMLGGSAKFTDLWLNNKDALAAVFNGDDSRADASLAAHLAWWTGCDAERMERLMRRSGLARPKYDRDDYLPLRTIPNAIAMNGDGCYQDEPASQEWPEPLPIPCTLLPVEAFDNNLLPVALRPWVADIAERMQCPPDFPAVGAMVALSSVIGRKVCIRPKRFDDWQVVPNLWGAIVGRPGVMKSPALSEVMKPLDRLATIAGDLHAEVMRDHEIKSKLEGMSGKSAETKAQKLVAAGKINEAEQLLTDAADAEGIAPPPLRRYKVTDASVEALGEILIENPWGTLAYRDELNGLLRSLDKKGQEGARAFYLQGYDGNQGYTFDRIMRGRNLNIPAVCIAMLGGIQPGKLQAYIHDAVSGGAGDDGLLQRFGLLVWPDVSGEWKNVDRWPDTPAKSAAYEAFQRLDALAPGVDAESGEASPTVYRFSPEAQALFEEWRQAFETDLRTGEHHPAMESHLAKYRKLVPAIALVCALADGEKDVGKDSLQRALAWSEYLQTHATRAYAAGIRPTTGGAAALLTKIKAGAVDEGFRPADVYLKGWAHLATPDDAHAAIKMLCDLHYLRQTEKRPGTSGGRPSITYHINPAILGGR